MSVQRLFPILRTRDLDALVGFYERAFGGEVTYRFEIDGRVVYVAMALGEGTVGIGFEPEATRGDAVAIWLYVADTDAAFATACDAGAEALSPPEDRAWGERVAELRDPDGNHLFVGAAAR